MRARLRILLYFAIFWICFQIAVRVLFLAYNSDLTSGLTGSEIARIFWIGLRMDMSMSGYFVMLTGLFLAASVYTQSRALFVALNAIMIIGIVLSCLVAIVDIELYRHWGFRMDSTPFFYLAGAEKEGLGSVEIGVAIKLLLIAAALIVISLFAYTQWLSSRLEALQPSGKSAFVVLMLVSVAMILPIRGSLSVAPMNAGYVYFHKSKSYANHAAINVVWNFLYSLTKASRQNYPENFMDHGQATAYFSKLYPASTGTTKVFTPDKPNIILFILESFTANVIEPLGGEKDVTPNLNRLCREGVLFDNFYASGDRTDKGVVSILSGYPAQPRTNIIKSMSKTRRLPQLGEHLRKLGYQTSFLYGGDIDFANFRSYFTGNYDEVVSREDFEGEYQESKWGLHDEIIFTHALAQCDSAASPFFKVILSQSSHEPFDVPMEPVFPESNPDAKFLDAMHYTDKCIGDFIAQAKRRAWWNNTVVLFVADHGHRQPGRKELADAARFRIPFIMTGGAIRRDTIIHTYGSQTDIANTVLGQLDRPSPEFRFSKDLLSPEAASFAVYFFSNGYGFLADGQYIVYDNTANHFLKTDGASPEDLQRSKAYQHMLFVDYNAK